MINDMPQSTEMDIFSEDELLRLAYAQPALGMALVSSAGRLRSLNAALATWLGGIPETLAGRPLEEIFPPEQAQSMRACLAEALRTRQLADAIVQVNDHTLSVSVVPLWDASGKPLGAQLLARPFATLKENDIPVTPQRQAAEETLQPHEAHYRLLAEDISDVVWQVDLRTNRFTYVSPSIERLLGYTPAEVMALPPESGLMPVSQADVSAWMERMVLEHFPSQQVLVVPNCEIQHLRKDGSPVWVEVTVVFVPDENGQPASLIGAERDISARKQAEAALRDSEAHYRLLTENMSDVVWQMDLRGNCFTYVSPSVERLRSYTVEEVMAMPVEAALTPASNENVRRWLEESIQYYAPNKQPLVMPPSEVEQPCKDGSTVWTEVVSVYLPDENGLPASIIGVSRDITARKKADAERQRLAEQLLEHERFLDSLLGELNGVVYRHTLDKDGQMLQQYASQGTLALTGYAAEDFIEGRIHWNDLVNPEELQKVDQQIHQTLDTNGLYQVEYRVRAADGQVRWVLDRGSVTKTVQDGITLKGIVFDITFRKQIETALQQSEARYRAVVETQVELIYRCDRDGRITFANPAYCCFVGKGLEEMIGMPFSVTIHPTESARVQSEIAALTPQQPTRAGMNRNTNHRGETRYIQWMDTALSDDLGQVVEYQAVGAI